jgi:hypothetical protein
VNASSGSSDSQADARAAGELLAWLWHTSPPAEAGGAQLMIYHRTADGYGALVLDTGGNNMEVRHDPV